MTASPTFIDMNGDDIRDAAGMTLALSRAELIELDALTAYYLQTNRSHYRDTEDLHWWICHMIVTTPILDRAAQRFDLADIAYIGMHRVYGI